MTYEVPDGRPATTFGTQGVTQKSTDRTRTESDAGLNARQMFPGYPDDWYSQLQYQLVYGGNPVDPGTALKINGVGEYTTNTNTGEVTFTPEPYFSGAAPTVGVRISNLTTANGQTQGADGSYTPVVTPSSVYLQPGFANGNVGETLKATPDYKPENLPKIDMKSITLIDDSGNHVGKTLTVAGQGTWTVDENGEFSFTPQAGFLGNPKPVSYTAKSVDGIAARQPSSVTVTYNPLVTRTATTIGGPAETQRSTDNNSPGDAGRTTAELFPGLPTEWFNNPVQFKLLDENGAQVDTLNVAGEGTYTIDPATGVVSFTPVEGFLGGATAKQASGVSIQAINTTSRGNKVSSTLVARYVPTVEDRTYTLPSTTVSAPELGQAWSAKPKFDSNIDPSTIQLLDANGNPADKTLDVPNQGTWTVDENGEFTFTPVPGFVGTPVSVQYTADANNGGTVEGTGAVTVVYPAAVTVPATTVGPQGTPQSSTDKDQNDIGRTPAEMFPDLPAAWYGQEDSPVKFRLLDAQGEPTGNTYTVDGVGTYTLDPAQGTVQFAPDPSFTGQAPQVQIQTVGLKDASGQPAEETSSYQPFVVPVRVEVPSAFEKAGRIGQPLTIEPEYSRDNTVDKSTIRMIAPEGATLTEDGKTLTVPGEGTWTVDENGNFTFTPQGPDSQNPDESKRGAFVGSPTPVDYTAKNSKGIPAQQPGQISAFYPTPAPLSVVTTDKQGVTQKSSDTGSQDQGLTAAEMFPNISQATWWNEAQFALYDASGNKAENNTLTVAGEGTYTIDPATGEVTFAPEPAFVGTAKPVYVGIANAQGTPKAKYTAVVDAVDVHLYDTSGIANVGEPIKVTPRYLDNVKKETVEFVGPNGELVGKELKVDGQGTWTVDTNGEFTFTPADGFYGTPTPVEYKAKDTDGVLSTETGTVSGEFRQPKTSPSVSTGDVNQPQTSKPGAEMFPSFPKDWNVTYSLSGAIENTVATDEGSFTIDPATGVVTFAPAKDFTGTPAPVTVQATTVTGATETTTYQVSATATETATATATETATATATETATATVTNPVETITVTADPATVTADPVTVTPDPVTVNPDPVVTTVTQVNEPQPVTVTQAPVTVTHEPITTVVTIPGEPTTLTTTLTINPEPSTVTPGPVTTTIPGGTETIAVTVTPSPVTVTQDPTTVTPDPVTITQVTTATSTVDNTRVEFTAGSARVDTLQGTEIKVIIQDEAVDTSTLKFRPVEGAVLTNDARTLTVAHQGTWTIGNDGAVHFVPEPGFTGELTKVELDYTRTDGAHTENPYTISGSYRPASANTTSATATATATTEPKGSSGNGVVERCFANAVRSPILWAIPIALLGQVGGKLAEPYIGQFQAQLNQMNAQLQEEIRRNTPDFGFGRLGQRNEQYERLVQQVNEANQQLQSYANRPEIQQLGRIGGVVLAVVAAGAVLYDWCSAEPGEAWTAIDFSGGRLAASSRQ